MPEYASQHYTLKRFPNPFKKVHRPGRDKYVVFP